MRPLALVRSAALLLLLALGLLVARPASATPDPELPLPAPRPAAAADAAAADPPGRGEVRGHIDWQAHPAMHIPWGFFGEGLGDREPTHALTWRHMFRQTVYAPYLKRSGVRIFMAAAMAAERARNPVQARRMILEQLEFMNTFVARHPADFAIARTPQEARAILATTDKMVIIHSIEGGRELLRRTEDAAFWRSQGVALLTVMHLLDDELGHAAMNEGFTGVLGNFFGSVDRAFHPNRRRGLTPRGREAIVELAQAGIIVDLTHMSPQSVDDALEVCRAHSIPPVVTHGMFKPIQDTERGFSREQVLEVYRLGGTFSIPIGAGSLNPHDPEVAIPEGLIPGTMDMFRFHAETLHRFIVENAATILGRPGSPGAPPADLTDADLTRLSLGWASDWNGWTSHTRPRPRRLRPVDALEIDRVGLAHPGLLPQHWQRLREAGMDLDPLERSAERFLQIWERYQAGSWEPAPVR